MNYDKLLKMATLYKAAAEKEEKSNKPFADFDPKITEQIDIFVRNCIKSLGASSCSVPQMQQDVLNTFSKQFKLKPHHIYNDSVVKYLYDIIEAAQDGNETGLVNHNLGLGIGQPTENDKGIWMTLNVAK